MNFLITSSNIIFLGISFSYISFFNNYTISSLCGTLIGWDYILAQVL